MAVSIARLFKRTGRLWWRTSRWATGFWRLPAPTMRSRRSMCTLRPAKRAERRWLRAMCRLEPSGPRTRRCWHIR
ncbi:hypothetical protein IWW55_002930 [Coemansia sp. RSA 2706]|nr:hypothetical protein IWW55_002930 [Coemansia sp. RSA 2706]